MTFVLRIQSPLLLSYAKPFYGNGVGSEAVTDIIVPRFMIDVGKRTRHNLEKRCVDVGFFPGQGLQVLYPFAI